MKTLLSTLALAATLVGCGAADQDSTVSTSLHPDTFKTELISVTPIEGTLLSTNIRREVVAPNVMGVRTDLNLQFTTGCTNELSPVTYEVDYSEARHATVYISAFEEVSKYSLVAFCAKPNFYKKTISLKGIFNKDNIKIIYNKGRSQTLKAAEYKVTATKDVRLGNFSPLCPEGARCVTDGTVIDVVIGTSGCMDNAALSYTAVKNGEFLDLYVGALNIGDKASDNVRCFRQNTKSFSISLVNQFYSKENVRLHIQGTK